MKYLKNSLIAIALVFSLITSCTTDKDRHVFSDKADIYLDNICNDLDSAKSAELRIQYQFALRYKAFGGQEGGLYMVEKFGKVAENLTFRDLLRKVDTELKDKDIEKKELKKLYK